MHTLTVAVCIVIALADHASAQSVSVEGTVRDTTGAPVANAQVEARGDGAPVRANSNEVGRYRIDGLSQGRYTIAVEFAGFAPIRLRIEGPLIRSSASFVPGWPASVRRDGLRPSQIRASPVHLPLIQRSVQAQKRPRCARILSTQNCAARTPTTLRRAKSTRRQNARGGAVGKQVGRCQHSGPAGIGGQPSSQG
jgi:hypothetical protein